MQLIKVVGSIFILLGVFLLAACMPVSTPTISPEDIYTAAAQTMAARLTLSAGGTAVAQLTEIASRPTALPSLPVSGLTTLPTLTPAIAHTPTPQPPPTEVPAPTSPPRACDAARLISDVTIPANSSVVAGVGFIKTWRIQNAGSCAWTPAYTLVFMDGESMGAPSVQGISGNVLPGETVDVSVSFTAPLASGYYENRWMLRNDASQLFDTVGQFQGSLWLRLQVLPAVTSSRYAYDFTSQACAASWSSSNGFITCPGSSGDPAGSVSVLANPNLGSRRENEPALWLRPGSGRNGWISGEYPPYRVVDGDRFVSEIGCLANSPQCGLFFRLDYRLSNGSVWNLGAWDEEDDGETTTINIDLASLADTVAQFILTVTNQGSVANANAFWFVPSIRNDFRTANLVLNWHQEGGVRKACDGLKIYIFDNQLAEARASSCKNGEGEIGRATLGSQDLRQLLEWVTRFSSFDGEVLSPSSGGPLTSYITLKGNGEREASSSDIQAMGNFAEKIFNSIAR